MTPVTLARKIAAYGPQLAGLGDKLTIKEAVVARVYASLLFEPSGSLLDKVMERMDGKVPQPVEASGPDGGPIEIGGAKATLAQLIRRQAETD